MKIVLSYMYLRVAYQILLISHRYWIFFLTKFPLVFRSSFLKTFKGQGLGMISHSNTADPAIWQVGKQVMGSDTCNLEIEPDYIKLKSVGQLFTH